MEFPLASSPHLHAGAPVAAVMRQVLYALVPGVAVCFWLFGWGVLVNLLLASLVAAACEALVLRLRQRPMAATLGDYSAIVTGVLLALALPPLVPWWLTVIAVGFAIVVAKQLFGGLGYNPFNPAMAGYVLVLISFPLEMTQWLPPGELATHPVSLADTLQAIFMGTIGEAGGIDAVTHATPLDIARTQLGLYEMLSEIRTDPAFGAIGGTGWQWLGAAYLLGGLYLIYRRVMTWHIPMAMIGALFLIAMVFQAWDSERFASPLFHLFSGGFMLGAFFIATDPVTSATTPRGKLLFGAGIGVLIYIIRTWGGYPDGIAFAVLLMNIAAPTIDYYTRPRVFGHKRP